jgi:hypothetical protein
MCLAHSGLRDPVEITIRSPFWGEQLNKGTSDKGLKRRPILIHNYYVLVLIKLELKRVYLNFKVYPERGS